MSHGTTSSSMTSSNITDLPDILKNLISVFQNESVPSNEYLVEIEVNVKKKETQNSDYDYDVAITDNTIENKKSKKKDKIDSSMLSKKKKRNRKNKKKNKSKNVSENSTICKTMRSRCYDENSDDDMVDSDDRYPDESLENLPYLNESERQLLKALRKEQTKKCKKKEKNIVAQHHIAVPWDSEENSEESSSSRSKSKSTEKPSSFSHHYPYIPRKNDKKNGKINHSKVDDNKNNIKKETFKPKSSKKSKNQKKNKESCHYVNAMDVLEKDSVENDNIENDQKIHDDITKDMQKIFG